MRGSVNVPGRKYIPASEKGQPNGVAALDADGKLPSGVIPSSATYTHPTTSGNKHIPSGGSSGQILRWSADGTAAWGADNNTTYSAATTSAAGLMSAADKTKLDGIAAGATKVAVDAELSSTSTNPVQNQAIQAELDKKSDLEHVHSVTDITTGGTLGVRVNASATAQATLANVTLRNIYAKTTDMTAGSTTLATGTICLIYE